MSLRALLLDLDGTLVDTNATHTDAWMDAFQARGYRPAREAVASAIGMGGDKLVPHLLGAEADAEDGDALREMQGEQFRARARATRFAFIEGAEALLAAARTRGLQTAICTSGSQANLDALFTSAPADLRERVDLVTTADDVDGSKPDPDVLHAALRQLDVEPGASLLLGDTLYDLEAARRAGVPFIGVTTWVWTTADFEARGARQTIEDLTPLAADLDAVGDY
ncbi:MAG: HAD family hydrolase [Rhodothermaceae bacterium]|nr:HAD family hydrolase [Rhodothermaceae bacterium]